MRLFFSIWMLLFISFLSVNADEKIITEDRFISVIDKQDMKFENFKNSTELTLKYELEKTSQDINAVKDRISDIGDSIEWFATLTTFFGVLITIIVFFFSFKSNSEARQTVEDWLEENGDDYINKELQPIKESFNKMIFSMQVEMEELKKKSNLEIESLKEQLNFKRTEVDKEMTIHVDKIKQYSDNLLAQYEEKILTQSSINNFELKDKYLLENEIQTIKIKPYKKRNYADWIKIIFYNISSNEYQEALNVTNNALKKFTSLIEEAKLLYLQGIIFDKMKKMEDAIFVLENSIEKVPSLAYPYRKLALIYAQINYEKSIFYAKKSLDLDDDYIAFNILSVVYRKKNNLEMAKEYLLKSLEINPDYARTYYYFGSLYTELGEYDNALNQYKKSLSLDKNYVVPYIGLFRLNLIQNQFFDKKLVEELYSKDIKHYGHYHRMLVILQDINKGIKKEEINKRMEEWSKNFGERHFRLFSFNIIEKWIDSIDDINTRKKLNHSLSQFKSYLYNK